MEMPVIIDVDLEKFRYSLIGDGYLKEEVIKMTKEELIRILKMRIYDYISVEYNRSKRFGYVD